MSAKTAVSARYIYLALAIAGYAITGIPMVLETMRSGNILFWTDPHRTASELFANLTSTSFALDAMVAAVVLIIWMTVESRRLKIGRVWLFWVLTLLFGIAGTFPLFLYFRERHLASEAA